MKPVDLSSLNQGIAALASQDDYLEKDGHSGSIRVRRFVGSHFRAVKVDGSISKPVDFQHNHVASRQSVVTCCFAGRGHVRLCYPDQNNAVVIRRGYHNFVYRAVCDDVLVVEPEEEEVSVFYFSIDANFFSGLLGSEDPRCISLRNEIGLDRMVCGSALPLTITPAMHGIMHDISTCSFDGALAKLMVEAKVMELVAHQLHQYFNLSIKSSCETENDEEIFYNVREYLKAHFGQPHSLRALSRRFGINECWLKKGFKKHFGVTVFSYLHALRMEHAKGLLITKRKSVSEVAAMAGYKNANHFSVAFKKNYGVVPSAFYAV